MQRRLLLLKDECPLCKRVISRQLGRCCFRCGRLYCLNCILFDKEGNVICLNCARRMVSPRKLGTKYSPLSRYLHRRSRFTNRVVLSFAKVEEIISDNLPSGAIRNKKWWTNTRWTAQGQAWMDVGWRIRNLDLVRRTVTFIRIASEVKKPKKKRKQSKTATSYKADFRFIRPKRIKPPSKTRIARAQARLRNVERDKLSMPQYPGKFKPKRAYEKRLFSSEAKPTHQDC